jgi:hypothetical protein
MDDSISPPMAEAWNIVHDEQRKENALRAAGRRLCAAGKKMSFADLVFSARISIHKWRYSSWTENAQSLQIKRINIHT